MELTPTMQRIYEYLAEQAQIGRVPSVREICKEVDIKSTGTVQKYLQKLEQGGYIERESALSRSIRLTGVRQPAVQVPLIGTVTAGMPILATESVEGYVPYAGQTDETAPLFALRVRGDSMVNAGILNGDIVIVKKTPVAENGTVVVALIEDEATVKRFYKENGHFRLQPENDDYAPIIVDEVAILGKVVSLIREEVR